MDILSELGRRIGTFSSLEDLLTSPAGFGLTTATPVQIAICRVVSGAPLADLANHPEVIEAFGGNTADIPEKPNEVLCIAAVRCAKSLIAAALGIWATQSVELDLATSEGDIPRFSIVSLEKDNAKQVLSHLIGACNNPGIRPLYLSHQEIRGGDGLIREAGMALMGSVFFRHPTGRPMEIRVVAGKRAGGSVISRFSAGMVLDEAPRMLGSADGVVNYDDMRKAVLGRLLPGAVLFSIGSPWARRGPIYEMVTSEWGKPTGSRVVMKARGPQMNPYWWTPERCQMVKESDPETYRTDVLAEFIDEEESMFPDSLLSKVTRVKPLVLPYDPDNEYAACMDAATRGNAWTFVITTADPVRRDDGSFFFKRKVVITQEWRGSKVTPLDPGEVLTEIGGILATYGLNWCYADEWSVDSIRRLAMDRGFHLVDEDRKPKEKNQQYLDLAADMAAGIVELSPCPLVRRDMLLVKKRATTHGFGIILPHTPDGRHTDFAPSLVRALSHWVEKNTEITPPEGTKERINWESQQRQEIAAQRLEDSENEPWWDFG